MPEGRICGGDREFGMDMYTLLYLKCITNKGTLPNVMYSLDRRGVWGRVDTCICMVESLCCTPEIITKLLISYIPLYIWGGFGMGNTCIPVADSCWCMAKPIQYCKVISFQLKLIFFKWKASTIVTLVCSSTFCFQFDLTLLCNKHSHTKIIICF